MCKSYVAVLAADLQVPDDAVVLRSVLAAGGRGWQSGTSAHHQVTQRRIARAIGTTGVVEVLETGGREEDRSWTEGNNTSYNNRWWRPNVLIWCPSGYLDFSTSSRMILFKYLIAVFLSIHTNVAFGFSYVPQLSGATLESLAWHYFYFATFRLEANLIQIKFILKSGFQTRCPGVQMRCGSVQICFNGGISPNTDEPMGFLLCTGTAAFYCFYLLHYMTALHINHLQKINQSLLQNSNLIRFVTVQTTKKPPGVNLLLSVWTKHLPSTNVAIVFSFFSIVWKPIRRLA